jgi:hypothetical protein
MHIGCRPIRLFVRGSCGTLPISQPPEVPFKSPDCRKGHRALSGRTSSTHTSRLLGRLARSLGCGVALAWISVYLISPALHLGMSELAANRIPFVGFAVGVGIGLSNNGRAAILGLFMPLIMGAVCGFIGLLVGVLIQIFGASEGAADRVSMVGLFFGLALGVFVGTVMAFDEFGKLAIGLGLKRAKPVTPDQEAGKLERPVRTKPPGEAN